MADIRPHHAGPGENWGANSVRGRNRLNPNESCLVQRFRSMPYSEVGPAMIGTSAAAEKIPKFSDEEKGTSLKDWLNDIWVKRDNYKWCNEQVARLIVECLR